jgi:hypothetical protein
MANIGPHQNIVRYLFHGEYNNKLCMFLQLYSTTLQHATNKRRSLSSEMEFHINHDNNHACLTDETCVSDEDSWVDTTTDKADGMHALEIHYHRSSLLLLLLLLLPSLLL